MLNADELMITRASPMSGSKGSDALGRGCHLKQHLEAVWFVNLTNLTMSHAEASPRTDQSWISLSMASLF